MKNRADFDLLINYIIENFEKDPDLVSCSREILFYPFSVLSNLRGLIENMAQKTKMKKEEVKNALKWWIHSLHTEAQVAILGYAKPDFSIANPISVASADVETLAQETEINDIYTSLSASPARSYPSHKTPSKASVRPPA